jgi:diacylglycerol kinase (ATP)
LVCEIFLGTIFFFDKETGIGVDAQVAHDFHTAREANPEKFSNRTLNKIKYVTLGVTTTLKGLSKALTLFCDNVEIPVPENCQAVRARLLVA